MVGSKEILQKFAAYILGLLFSTYALQPSKAYCAIWVRRSNFRHQASPRERTHWRKVGMWAKNVREFCLNSEIPPYI